MLEQRLEALSGEKLTSWWAFNSTTQIYVHGVVFQEKINNSFWFLKPSVWSQGFKSGLNLEDSSSGSREVPGARRGWERLLGLWPWGGEDDRKEWLLGGPGMIKGKRKKKKEIKLWIFSLMCLATYECLVLISVLSSQQHSEQRKCYDSHLAQMGTWGCENAQESLGWSRQLSLWSLISNQMFAPWWPSIRGCARSLEMTPIGWAGFVPSAVGCVPRLLSTLCWENPPKQQSVFEP